MCIFTKKIKFEQQNAEIQFAPGRARQLVATLIFGAEFKRLTLAAERVSPIRRMFSRLTAAEEVAGNAPTADPKNMDSGC